MAKRLFKAPSAKFKITLGLIGLLMSLLFMADMLSLIPDRLTAQREGRAALAEAVAANNTMYLTRQDYRRMKTVLDLVVERNPDLLSAAMRRADGKLMVEVGEHASNWASPGEHKADDTRLVVPIWGGDSEWGQLELRYRPLIQPGWRGNLQQPLVKLVAFLAIAGFVSFYLYLGRMLKYLDPSEAVPERVREALDTMAEGLLLLDRKEQIILANRAFSKLMEKNPRELVGLDVTRFEWTGAGEQTFEPATSPWRKALSEGRPQMNTMVRLMTRGAGWRTFMVNCSPVLGEGNRAGGVLVSLDDVTTLEEKEKELRRSKEEAEEANRAKSIFLANMSHEIRTPMNAILGFTEVLKRGFGNSGQDSRKYLETIHSSGRHLLALINDILDLSKVEAGRLEVEKLACDPYAIVRETVQIFQVKAREKGITLGFEVENPVPAKILTDPARLRQIVTNLVGNSLKFTDQGGVKVVARFIDSQERPQLALDVVDTGIGMTEEQQQKIFDPFVQADNSITRRFGGTGLGLSISLRFARALGGELRVRSAPGEGSVFTLILDTGPLQGVPLLQPEAVLSGDEVTAGTEHARWRFAPSRVLVVDDGDENRELVKLVLEEVGLVVDTADNGRSGADKALAGRYDMILMDVQMPVMDGYSAVRLLREKGLELPILALTAHAMNGIEQKCLDAGFTAVLTKPIDIDGLIDTLAQRLACQPVDPATPPEPAPEIGSEQGGAAQATGDAARGGPPIVSRLAAGNPRFRPLIERFTQRLEEQLEAMEQAWLGKDFDELKALAHWLKGAGGTVGFDVFTKPAQRLEQCAINGEQEKAGEFIAELRRLSGRITTEDVADGVVDDSAGDEGQATLRPATPAEVPAEVVSRLPMDNPRVREIVRKFVTRLELQLDTMRQSLERNDFERLAMLAHWLKGAGGTVGFDAFTAPARALEQSAKSADGEGARQHLDQLQRLAQRIALPVESAPASEPGGPQVQQG